MSKKGESYSVISMDGTTYNFHNINEYQAFIKQNPHLFILTEETPQVAPDTRYNVPKVEPSVDIEEIKQTIQETEIYRRTFALMQSAQRRQVGYGMEKYPEPLNANTWSIVETIDHIIDESIDKLHYLVMLRIKLEQTIIREEQ